jgi:hypothetical protein
VQRKRLAVTDSGGAPARGTRWGVAALQGTGAARRCPGCQRSWPRGARALYRDRRAGRCADWPGPAVRLVPPGPAASPRGPTSCSRGQSAIPRYPPALPRCAEALPTRAADAGGGRWPRHIPTPANQRALIIDDRSGAGAGDTIRGWTGLRIQPQPTLRPGHSSAASVATAALQAKPGRSRRCGWRLAVRRCAAAGRRLLSLSGLHRTRRWQPPPPAAGSTERSRTFANAASAGQRSIGGGELTASSRCLIRRSCLAGAGTGPPEWLGRPATSGGGGMDTRVTGTPCHKLAHEDALACGTWCQALPRASVPAVMRRPKW